MGQALPIGTDQPSETVVLSMAATKRTLKARRLVISIIGRLSPVVLFRGDKPSEHDLIRVRGDSIDRIMFELNSKEYRVLESDIRDCLSLLPVHDFHGGRSSEWRIIAKVDVKGLEKLHLLDD